MTRQIVHDRFVRTNEATTRQQQIIDDVVQRSTHDDDVDDDELVDEQTIGKVKNFPNFWS